MKCKFIRRNRDGEIYFEKDADLNRVPMKSEIVSIDGKKVRVEEIRTIIDGDSAFCEIKVGRSCI